MYWEIVRLSLELQVKHSNATLLIQDALEREPKDTEEPGQNSANLESA